MLIIFGLLDLFYGMGMLMSSKETAGGRVNALLKLTEDEQRRYQTGRAVVFILSGILLILGNFYTSSIWADIGLPTASVLLCLSVEAFLNKKYFGTYVLETKGEDRWIKVVLLVGLLIMVLIMLLVFVEQVRLKALTGN